MEESRTGHSSRSRWLRRGLATGTVALLCAAGCGSDEGGGGANGGVCQPGETQTCVAPAASGTCTGAQTCNADGSAWGDCLCGGQGGSGGGGNSGGTGASAGSGATGASGGMGGTGANGGTSGSGGNAASGGTAGLDGGTGATGGAAGSGGTGGTAADAAPDAPPPKQPGPLDDPCPITPYFKWPIDINCSDQCVPTDTDTCAKLEWCGEKFDQIQVTIKSEADLPLVVRLPANPPVTKCSYCLNKTWQIKIKVDAPFGLQWAAQVGKPWRVMTDAGGCPGLGGKPGCDTGIYYGLIGVGTDDPAAPSRNLVIRKETACVPWN